MEPMATLGCAVETLILKKNQVNSIKVMKRRDLKVDIPNLLT